MAKNKTTATAASVHDFIAAVPDAQKRADGFKLAAIMAEATGYEPKMWGPSIVGFGSYQYTYPSGHSGEAPLAGFSPRTNAISLYVAVDPDKREGLLAKLGKAKPAKGCIYIKKLSDVDEAILRKFVTESVKYLSEKYPS